MTPYQVNLVKLYGDILIIDVCEKRNRYSMYLTTIVAINGNNNSRNVAYALHESQDSGTFGWILTCFQKSQSINFNGVLEPTAITPTRAIFSDRDAAIRVAVIQIYPNTFHGLCLWHINENLTKNLQSVLGQQWEAFKIYFWKTYRMGSKETFEIAWKELLLRFPSAEDYLSRQLFPCRDQWAWYSVGSHFCAGLRTTGRVEGEHKNYKLNAFGSNTTLNNSFRINKPVSGAVGPRQ